ncbi:ABC transporter, partial [Rhizobium ruizarguesonis]
TGGEVVLDGDNILALGKNGIRQIRGARVCYVAQSAAAAFNPAHRLGDQGIEESGKEGLMSKEKARARALDLCGVRGL